MLTQTLKTNIKNPCYKCEDREIGCHSTCEKYNEWKKEHEILYEAERRERLSYRDPRETLRTATVQNYINKTAYKNSRRK